MNSQFSFKRTLLALALFVGSTGLWSCTNWVQSVQPRNDVITDAALTNPDQLNFLLAGMQQRMTQVYGRVGTLAGALSDELFFDPRVPGATFPQFQELENGLIALDNNSVNGLWGTNVFGNADGGLGSLRFTADNFLERVAQMQFPTGAAGDAQRRNALYQGYLHAGAVRYFYATLYGLSERRGGGVLSRGNTPGPFLPAAAMTDSAIAMYNLALQNASNDAQRRIINTLIAKANLADRRYTAAAAAAQNGMRSGDAAQNVGYSAATVQNWWFNDAGRGRAQLVPDLRFAAYIRIDSAEGRIITGRNSGNSFFAVGPEFTNIPDDPVLGSLAGTRRIVLLQPPQSMGLEYYIQQMYPNQGSSIALARWQENELILAETSVRAGNADAALTNVNNVRRAFGLAARTATNLDSIIVERDKTLFGTGARLIDQRRFELESRQIVRNTPTYVAAASRNNAWHLPDNTWRWLPIGLPERSANPNLGLGN